MKRRSKAGRFAKESERRGLIFSTEKSTPLAAWMQDPTLLPKSPPKRSNETPQRRS